MATYTLDAQLPNGAYAHDNNLTEQQVRNAYLNADRLGITILSVTRDDNVALSAQDIRTAFGG